MGNEQKSRAFLDRDDSLLMTVLDGIRNEPAPEFPDPELLSIEAQEQSLVSVNDYASRGVQQKVRLKRWMFVATTMGAVFLVMFVLWPGSAPSALARMQEALRKVRTVSYSVFDHHANGDTWETKVWIVEPDYSRSEQRKLGEGLAKNGVQLSDYSKNLKLFIDHRKRTASFIEISPSEELEIRRHQLMQKFRNVSENAIEDLGPDIFNDRPVHAFRMSLSTGGREFTVLVDDETSLPVEMEYEDESTGFREVFTGFKFDEEIDLALFSLEAPEGYAVKKISLEKPPEEIEVLVVSPETGIGSVAFGSDAETIIDLLGKPSDERSYAPQTLPGSKSDPQGFKYLKFNSLGIEVGVNSEHGMTTIRCLSQVSNGPSIHDFTGRTPEGIQIGSSVKDVREAYGDPELAGKQSLHYLRKGWRFGIRVGKVTGIDVKEPVPDEIEITVNEDGSWSTQVRKSD